MKKRYTLLSFMLMLGIGMQAQSVYTYVKQDGKYVSVNGTAKHDVDNQDVSVEFDEEGNVVMSVKSEFGTFVGAKLMDQDMENGGRLAVDFDNQSGETTLNKRDVTITQDGYATFYSPFPVLYYYVPDADQIKLFAPTYSNGNILLSNEVKTGKYLPACTGLLAKNYGDEGVINTTTIQFTFYAGQPTFTATSALVGTAVAFPNPTPDVSQTYDNNAFVLANKSEGVEFYQYVGETLSAGKAYIMAPLSEAYTKSSAKAVIFEDIATDIESIENNNSESVEAKAYNILGQRVNVNSKGFVIINGKKYINK